MNNLDRQKYQVPILVFDNNNDFITSYYETVHAASYPTPDDKAHARQELKTKLARTAYYHDGYALVSNNDFTGPILVRKQLTRTTSTR